MKIILAVELAGEADRATAAAFRRGHLKDWNFNQKLKLF
jgi:hypothetical protein